MIYNYGLVITMATSPFKTNYSSIKRSLAILILLFAITPILLTAFGDGYSDDILVYTNSTK